MTRRALQCGGISVGRVPAGWLAALTLCLLIGGAPKYATGQAADQDLMAMPLEDLARVQVYSASRHLEDVRKAPSSVSIITAEDIRRYGWRTLGEALRSLRGFYISDNRQYTYLGVRGFMRPGDDNPRILLLINGHRLNDRIYDTAAVGTEFPLDLALIDHIEVVRGPGSSLYGTNAIFGVINVITRDPGRETALEMEGGTGSLDSRTGRGTLLGKLGPVSGLLSGSMYRSAGNARLFFPEFATPETNDGWAENDDGAHAEHAFVQLTDGDLTLEGLLADRIRHFPTGAGGAAFDDPSNQENDTRGYLDLSLRRKLGDATDLEVRCHYDAYNYVGSGDYGPPSVPPTPVRVKGRADWVGVEATVTRQIGKQRVTGGAEYEHSLDVKQWSYAVGAPPVFWSNQTPWLASAFVDAELKVIPQIIVHIGARVDKDSEFAATLSPRAAVIWLPDQRTAVKYMVGRAFRDPNAYEAGYADGITVAPGPPLKPEQILSHEIVVERSLKPWLTVTADGFYNQLKDLIDQVPDGDTTLSWFVNDDRVHAQGLEAEADAHRESGLGLRATWTATMATDDIAHAPLENAPHNQASLNGSLPVRHWGSAALEGLYVSAITDMRGTRVPGYFLPNLTFAAKPFWGGWQFSSSLYNVFDRRWSSPAGPNDPEDQIAMDGRSWRFQLGYRLPVRGGRREP